MQNLVALRLLVKVNIVRLMLADCFEELSQSHVD